MILPMVGKFNYTARNENIVHHYIWWIVLPLVNFFVYKTFKVWICVCFNCGSTSANTLAGANKLPKSNWNNEIVVSLRSQSSLFLFVCVRLDLMNDINTILQLHVKHLTHLRLKIKAMIQNLYIKEACNRRNIYMGLTYF